MNIKFSKMNGAGNDFVVMDSTEQKYRQEADFVKFLCNRHKGIGADGVMYLSKNQGGADVKMDFYNNDGSRAEMCGNGLRCAAVFAHKYFFQKDKIIFSTDSGLLETEVTGENTARIGIPILEEFQKATVDGIVLYKGNTGVPHAVILTENLEKIDVKNIGAKLRYHKFFEPVGTNVNFIAFEEKDGSKFRIRTYERGVEGETLACGTGITAAAVAANKFLNAPALIEFITEDNDVLKVELLVNANIVKGARLTGPAIEVFQGTLSI